MKHSPAFLALVEEARGRIREVSVDDVRRMQEAHEDFLLIDVREDHEWAKGHAKGAVHMGRGILERDIEMAIADKDKRLVLYCGGGFRSAFAADNLQKMGYRQVLSMDGGYRAWNESGAPCDAPHS